MTYIILPCENHINIEQHTAITLTDCTTCKFYQSCYTCKKIHHMKYYKDSIKSNLPTVYFCENCISNKKQIFTSQ